MSEFLTSLAQATPLSSLANSAYKNLQKSKNDTSIKETFSNQNPINTLNSSIQLIILIFALYLAFKCSNGFDIGQVLLACCCSPCYIAYRLAVPCVDDFILYK